MGNRDKIKAAASKMTALQLTIAKVESGNKQEQTEALVMLTKLARKSTEARLYLIALKVTGQVRPDFTKSDREFLTRMHTRGKTNEVKAKAAFLLARSMGRPQDLEALTQVRQLLEEASAEGVLPAKEELAYILAWRFYQFEAADELYRELINEEYTQAYASAALVHLKGELARPNVPEAIGWLRTGVQHNNPHAMYLLGQLYAVGCGAHLSADITVARDLYIRLSRVSQSYAKRLESHLHVGMNRAILEQHEVLHRVTDARFALGNIPNVSPTFRAQVEQEVEQLAVNLVPQVEGPDRRAALADAPHDLAGPEDRASPAQQFQRRGSDADEGTHGFGFGLSDEEVSEHEPAHELSEIPLEEDVSGDRRFGRRDVKPLRPQLAEEEDDEVDTSEEAGLHSVTPDELARAASSIPFTERFIAMLRSPNFYSGLIGVLTGVALVVCAALTLIPAAFTAVAVAIAIGGAFLTYLTYKSPALPASSESESEVSDAPLELSEERRFVPSYQRERERLEQDAYLRRDREESSVEVLPGVSVRPQ